MTAIAKPFGALLMWLYEFTSNYGLAVILFALLVKVILLPFQMKSKRGTMRMSRLSAQMKELEKRHGANKQKYNEEVQKLYQSEGVNPMSGYLWTLLPFPILIALYYAIRLPLTTMMGIDSSLIAEGGVIYNTLASMGFDFSQYNSAYIEIAEAQFIARPENWGAFSGFEGMRQIDYSFIGLDLGVTPDFKLWAFDWSSMEALLPSLGLFLIPIIAALITWLQTKITTKLNPSSGDNPSMSSMTLMMPIMTLVFAFMMPAALGIYWIASSVFGLIQDVILTLHYNKVLDKEDAANREARAKREAELAEKRKATELLKAQNATTANPNTSKRKQQQKQKQEQEEKATEWERKHAPLEDENANPSQVGNRRYARGRAYDPNRYSVAAVAETEENENVEDVAVSEVPEIEETSLVDTAEVVSQSESSEDTPKQE